MNLQKVLNSTFEEEAALINMDTNEILCSGDYYHDKINEYIDGFLNGLKYSGIKFELLDEKDITPDDELFKLCGFYDCDD